MKCKEFRKEISRPETPSTEAETHLEHCAECQLWIEKEISSPPPGLSEAQWQTSTARCFPEATVKSIIETNSADKPAGFWGFFADGLKFGMVFGLSIVTGFAILSVKSETVESFDLKKRHAISFYEASEGKLPEFYEKEKMDVTFFDYSDSNLLSFVEKSEIPEFFDKSQEEEI